MNDHWKRARFAKQMQNVRLDERCQQWDELDRRVLERMGKRLHEAAVLVAGEWGVFEKRFIDNFSNSTYTHWKLYAFSPSRNGQGFYELVQWCIESRGIFPRMTYQYINISPLRLGWEVVYHGHSGPREDICARHQELSAALALAVDQLPESE